VLFGLALYLLRGTLLEELYKVCVWGGGIKGAKGAWGGGRGVWGG
jgi:hypothetical protein